MSKEDEIVNFCTVNPNHEYIEMKQVIVNEDGTEEIIPLCANCEEERLKEAWDKVRDSSDPFASESMEEYLAVNDEMSGVPKSASPDKPNERKMPLFEPIKPYDFIEKYSKKLADITNAPLEASKAMAQFVISIALHRLEFANGKGHMRANLGFIWLAPSGSYKTPLYDWGITDPYKMRFKNWGYRHFKRIGGRSLISAISNIKQEDLVEKKALALITLDEASTLAKDSNADGLSDTFEAFAQAYDGQLASSHTIQRRSEYPHPSYSPIWFQGTPIFLKYVSEDFWDIGLGNRMFFIPYTIAEVQPIPDYRETKQFYGEFLEDLELMREANIALFDPPAKELYNAYEMGVRKEIQSVQTDLESSIDNNNFDITSKVKIPSHLIKMAIVCAASRFNIHDKILWIAKEDVERAIEEVEKYHKTLVYIHQIWENQSAQRLKHESVEVLANKIFNHIDKLKTNNDGKKSYTMKRETTPEGDESYLITGSPGPWVKHSDLLKNSHMKAKGPKSFEEIMVTLDERHQVFRREAFLPEKDDGKSGKTWIFYAINGNEVEKNEK